MKKVKIIRLSDQDKEEVRIMYEREENPSISLDEIFEKNDNQTLSALRNIGNSRTNWDGIEQMTDFTAVIKKLEECKTDEVELDNNEVRVVKAVLESSVKDAQTSFNIEKFTSIYESFCV